MEKFDSIVRLVRENIDTAVARVAPNRIRHYAAESVVAFAHVGRLGVPIVYLLLCQQRYWLKVQQQIRASPEAYEGFSGQ